MWPFKKKEIHNPDCFMCCELGKRPKVKGVCSRTGCGLPAKSVVFHTTDGWARWSYLCDQCFKEHNWFFYGKNEFDSPRKEGFLFTPPEGVVILPPIQYEASCGCNCP